MRDDLVYGSTKRWSAVTSTAFRQWRADGSHCAQGHGYGLTFEATFESARLDTRNWVVDFGGLKTFKGWLEHEFDHAFVVAQDDPELLRFQGLAERGALTLRIVPAVGCEAFAMMAFERMERWLIAEQYAPRVSLVKMQVWEHEGNSAYVRKKEQG